MHSTCNDMHQLFHLAQGGAWGREGQRRIWALFESVSSHTNSIAGSSIQEYIFFAKQIKVECYSIILAGPQVDKNETIFMWHADMLCVTCTLLAPHQAHLGNGNAHMV